EQGITLLRNESCPVEHKSKIVEHIRTVLKVVKKTPPFNDDVSIEVGDHKLNCSKWILTRQSEVFKQRFSGPWSEVKPRAPKGEEVAMEIFFHWLNDFEFTVPETATADDLLHFLHELKAYELDGIID